MGKAYDVSDTADDISDLAHDISDKADDVLDTVNDTLDIQDSTYYLDQEAKNVRKIIQAAIDELKQSYENVTSNLKQLLISDMPGYKLNNKIKRAFEPLTGLKYHKQDCDHWLIRPTCMIFSPITPFNPNHNRKHMFQIRAYPLRKEDIINYGLTWVTDPTRIDDEQKSVANIVKYGCQEELHLLLSQPKLRFMLDRLNLDIILELSVYAGRPSAWLDKCIDVDAPQWWLDALAQEAPDLAMRLFEMKYYTHVPVSNGLEYLLYRYIVDGRVKENNCEGIKSYVECCTLTFVTYCRKFQFEQ
jgi:hypothetical protein